MKGSGSKSQPAAKEPKGKPSETAAPAAPARSNSSSSGQHAAMPASSFLLLQDRLQEKPDNFNTFQHLFMMLSHNGSNKPISSTIYVKPDNEPQQDSQHTRPTRINTTRP